MHSNSARTAPPSLTAGFLLALGSFADEVCGTFARLFAYVGALALIAILALAFWQQVATVDSEEPGLRSAWTVADGVVPTFALRLSDQPDKSATYTVLRHPLGGRKDIFRWGEQSNRLAAAELEIYRFGTEPEAQADPTADLATRMMFDHASDLESAGIADSKLGRFALLRRTGANDGVGACLGFTRSMSAPALRISGWTCQAASAAARRAAVGCMLNRLTLLSSEREGDLANLFAGDDLRRTACDGSATAGGAADWVISADNPRLRGAL